MIKIAFVVRILIFQELISHAIMFAFNFELFSTWSLLSRFAVLLLPLLRLRPMLLSFTEDMDMELVWGMLDLAMVLDLAMLVLAMDMDLLPQLLPDTESPMLPTL